MSHKDFLLFKQWLIDVEYVVFYLEHSFLGRPGDNQFKFLDASLRGDVVIVTFSSDLIIEIVGPSNVKILKSCTEFDSIKVLKINWGNDSILLRDASLQIAT